MKRFRGLFVLLMLVLLGVQAYADEQAFMGFDPSSQKMYAVVRADQPFRCVVNYQQSNPGGWIGDIEVFYAYPDHPREAWSAGEVSPVDRERFTDIPEGQINVITAQFDLYDENDNYLFTVNSTDTLVAHYEGDEGRYIYVNGCTPDLPTQIPNPWDYPAGWSYCAFICHGSYAIPVYCDARYPGFDPPYELSVSIGCNPTNTHCDNPDCPAIDPSLFAWNVRVFSGCRKYLILTYCDGTPGCVCIWSWDHDLPVEMNNFDAVAGDHRVALNWSTASESDLQHFRIARSEDPNGVFLEVYRTPATNQSNGARYTWTDTDVENGKTYYYRLYIVDANGAHGYGTLASATPSGAVVTDFELAQNFPNPFNSQTSFSFSLPASELVTLKVFNLMGQEIATVLNRDMAAGQHTVNWTAEGLTTGVYMYTLTAGSYSETKKLLYLK